MKKNLTATQILKGSRYLKNARFNLHNSLNNLVQYKKRVKGFTDVAGYIQQDINKLQNEINEHRERVAQLERKYL